MLKRIMNIQLLVLLLSLLARLAFRLQADCLFLAIADNSQSNPRVRFCPAHQSDQPIGVIDVSRGGTTVETWTPDSVLRKIDAPEVTSKLAEWDEKIAAYDRKADLRNRIKRHHDWVARMKKDGKEIPADRTLPSDLRPGPAMDQNRPVSLSRLSVPGAGGAGDSPGS